MKFQIPQTKNQRGRKVGLFQPVTPRSERHGRPVCGTFFRGSFQPAGELLLPQFADVDDKPHVSRCFSAVSVEPQRGQADVYRFGITDLRTAVVAPIVWSSSPADNSLERQPAIVSSGPLVAAISFHGGPNPLVS